MLRKCIIYLFSKFSKFHHQRLVTKKNAQTKKKKHKSGTRSSVKYVAPLTSTLHPTYVTAVWIFFHKISKKFTFLTNRHTATFVSTLPVYKKIVRV